MEYSLPRHMPALDGLRGVAILLVILTHVGDGWRRALMTMQDADWMAPLQVPHWLSLICERGAYGVVLFFVVSAFTLTIQAGRQSGGWAAYAARRIARIGPGYWLAALAYTLAAGLGPRLLAPQGVTPADLGVAAIFGSAWQGGAALAVVPGGWSVSCEVAFYAALPLLVWVIKGRLVRAVLLTIAAAVGAQKLGRYAMVHGGLTTQAYFHPLIHLPVFLCGVTAALLTQRARLPRSAGLPLGLLALAVLGLPFLPVQEYYLMHHLAFAAVVAAVVGLSAQHPPADTCLPCDAPHRRSQLQHVLGAFRLAGTVPRDSRTGVPGRQLADAGVALRVDGGVQLRPGVRHIPLRGATMHPGDGAVAPVPPRCPGL